VALLVPPPIKRVAANNKRKAQGLLFILFIFLFLLFVVALYNKSLVKTVPVSLRTDRIGNQLSLDADVKFRGVNVGEVRALSTNGEVATLKLAMMPDQIKLIPSNVQARILPKTLFGQKYVDLVSPDNTGTQQVADGSTPQMHSLRGGDVITQDRSQTGIEIEQVYDNLLPFLDTVQPDKLNETLSAVATALDGRGDELGDNLVRLDDYLRAINQHLPSVQDDVSELADYSQILNNAAPDLLRFLGNTTVTSQTIVEKQNTLLSLLTGSSQVADTGSAVLSENRDRLIQSAALGSDITRTVARRANNLPLIFNGLAGLVQPLHTVFGGGTNQNWLHISLSILGQKGAYTAPADCPKYLSPEGNMYGPNCGAGGSASSASTGDATATQLPSSSVPSSSVPSSSVPSASTTTGQLPATGTASGNVGGGLGGSALDGTSAAPVDLTVDTVGSPQEKAMLARIVGAVNEDQTATHDMSPDLASLFLGPMLRGTEVSFK
jgi:phospholipid/cholesterol/gamma-HCH transport system substrate-binding protein